MFARDVHSFNPPLCCASGQALPTFPKVFCLGDWGKHGVLHTGRCARTGEWMIRMELLFEVTGGWMVSWTGRLKIRVERGLEMGKAQPKVRVYQRMDQRRRIRLRCYQKAPIHLRAQVFADAQVGAIVASLLATLLHPSMLAKMKTSQRMMSTYSQRSMSLLLTMKMMGVCSCIEVSCFCVAVSKYHRVVVAQSQSRPVQSRCRHQQLAFVEYLPRS